MKDVKYVDIKEFRETGFLQEANRQFFHPHGLALEITIVDEGGWEAPENNPVVAHLVDQVGKEAAIDILNLVFPEGTEFISGVWDYRDDDEGIWFDWPVWEEFEEGGHPRDKAIRVVQERRRHCEARITMLKEAYGPIALHTRDIEPYLWSEAATDG